MDGLRQHAHDRDDERARNPEARLQEVGSTGHVGCQPLRAAENGAGADAPAFLLYAALPAFTRRSGPNWGRRYRASSASNFRSSSHALSPVTGSTMSGATSASGPRTKKRSRKRGCGTCRPGVVEHAVAEQDQVEIQGPWCIREGALAAAGALDGEETRPGDRARRGRSADRNRIEIEGLVAKPLPFRFGFDERRNRQVGDDEARRSTANATAPCRSPRLLPMRDGNRKLLLLDSTGCRSTPPPVPAPSARRPSRSVRPASACSKNRLCSSVSPMMTRACAMAGVGHRFDPRPPLVDERLRRVAILRQQRRPVRDSPLTTASPARATLLEFAAHIGDRIAQPVQLHVFAADDVLVGVVEVVVGHAPRGRDVALPHRRSCRDGIRAAARAVRWLSRVLLFLAVDADTGPRDRVQPRPAISSPQSRQTP